MIGRCGRDDDPWNVHPSFFPVAQSALLLAIFLLGGEEVVKLDHVQAFDSIDQEHHLHQHFRSILSFDRSVYDTLLCLGWFRSGLTNPRSCKS